ncbi:MAG: peptidylprolyl isomerase [Candidatus Omnitrophica bacterium]|nr:peptidylprolyl isomerase [Candidatus Omnitrophota bacterium]
MSRKYIILFIFLLLCAQFFFGCSKKSAPDGRILARAGNHYITVSDFRARVDRMPSYYQSVVDKNKRRYLDEMIAERLFYEEALREGINKDKEVLEIIEEAKKKIIIAKFIKTQVDDKASVSEEDMKKFYELHKEDFRSPEMWRASHILVSSEAEAKSILEELSKGAKFEDLARQKSMDATASRGGDIGYFKTGQLIPDFEKACLKLNVGEISDVIHTQFGYHIVKLTDKKSGGLETYESARQAIELELKKASRRALFDQLVDRLKKKYGVEIQEEVLKSLESQTSAEDASGKQL